MPSCSGARLPSRCASFRWPFPRWTTSGFLQSVSKFAEEPSGLVLTTGPTGAGKSTTLASLIDHVNMRRQCHILTIEDPIEYMYSHKKAVVSQREIGTDADSFEVALRAALREDPDVILVGEMRDLESIAATLTLAETGHLVFATLHTNDTAQAIDRIIDVFPTDRRDQIQVQLSSTLRGVIYQRLIPRIGGGLVGAYEIMLCNNAVKNLVREGKTRQLRNVVSTARAEGMQTLEANLSELIARGIISEESALSVSLHPREIVVSAERAPHADARHRAAPGAPQLSRSVDRHSPCRDRLGDRPSPIARSPVSSPVGGGGSSYRDDCRAFRCTPQIRCCSTPSSKCSTGGRRTK